MILKSDSGDPGTHAY